MRGARFAYSFFAFFDINMYDGGVMKENINERVLRIADYISETGATVREAAGRFDVSKSTVHSDMVRRLPKLDPMRYEKVKEILNKNFCERHLRGGEKTKQKYRKMREL